MEPKSLLQAVETDDLMAAVEAFKTGADPNGPDALGRPMIFTLIERTAAGAEGDAETSARRVIFIAFCNNKADLNARDADGVSPLNLALRLKDYFLATLLVASGANFDEVFPDGSTPMHEATRLMLAGEGNRLMTALLWKQPDPTIKDASGKSAIDLADAANTPTTPEVRGLLAALPKAQALSAETRQSQLQQKAKQQKFKLNP